MDTKRTHDASASLHGMLVMHPPGLFVIGLLLLSGMILDRSVLAQTYRYSPPDEVTFFARYGTAGTDNTPPPAAQPRGVAAPVLGGVAGGALGLVGGALIGYTLEAATCEPDDWFCGLGGMLIGGAIGEVVGLPLGVHMGNGKRGNYGRALLASFGIAAAGVLAVAALEENSEAIGGVVLVGVPVAQLAAAVSIERATGN